jgi:hypothetical protein
MRPSVSLFQAESSPWNVAIQQYPVRCAPEDYCAAPHSAYTSHATTAIRIKVSVPVQRFCRT